MEYAILILTSLFAYSLFTQRVRALLAKSHPAMNWGALAILVGLCTLCVSSYFDDSLSLWLLTRWFFATGIVIILGTKNGRKFMRTDSAPPTYAYALLASVLFILLASFYLDAAYTRHAENEMDKVMPIPSQILEGFNRVAFEEDKRTGDLRLWVDTLASMKLFGVSMLIICFGGVLLGLNMGVFRWVAACFKPFMTFFDKIPALALLPILFVIFAQMDFEDPADSSNAWKIALMVIGVLPTIALDAYERAKNVPKELIYKAQTLAATEQEICYRVVLPSIMPDVLNTIRLNIKSVLNLLIAAEAVEASVGLGYRIFVVRRYMAMDVIIPYVLWMTVLFFVLDYGIQYYIRLRYPWHEAANK